MTMKTSLLLPLAGLVLLIGSGDAFSAVAPSKAETTPTSTATSSSTSTTTAAKYDGPAPSKVKTPDNFLTQALEYPAGEQPAFDVLAKTIAFATTYDDETRNQMYATDYVFRGSIIGPITRQDVTDTQDGFQIRDAYPNIDTRPFGFTVDPDNPFRCYYFERWEGTNTGDLQVGPLKMKATDNDVKLPTHIMSLHYNREGLVRYACLSSPLDRFEGNTRGAGAVFGLLVGGGLQSGNANVGDPLLRLQQRLTHAIGSFGRNWSLEVDIPRWFASKARGADPTDM
mmetsp:Transcript_5020/g.14253  ORF Transcript_5020/g.14253 Transcript_5020/m.14253 type:complete len:284 (-) Transcript_5020:17-868(-)